jgi:epoxide hydrolase-like predicted phosphatase
MKKFAVIFMTAFLTTLSLPAAPKAVVFDFGGVMTREPKKEAVVQFLRSTFGLSEAEFEKVNLEKREAVKAGKSDEEFWRKFAEKKGIILSPNWSQTFKMVMKDAISINPEVYVLVAELKAKQIPVALLSNIDTRLAKLVREFGLYEPFEPCLLSCEIGVEKPDPKAYQVLLEQLNLSTSEEVIFIDDRQENIDVALKLGFDAILFTSLAGLRNELDKRDCFSMNGTSDFHIGLTHPFDYDLHLFSIPGSNSRTMICCHGYGRNYQIAETLKDLGIIDSTLISFNFPDHDLQTRDYDPQNATFCTINELLPAIYFFKKYIIDEGLDAVDLYGKSAGGGAVVNLISILHTDAYEYELSQIGIKGDEQKRILKAIQNGVVILDVPLKSVDEIINLRGTTPELEILAKKYRDHHLRPIDSLEHLKGLSLNIILHFQNPDEIIFNRDDDIYIEKLKKVNQSGTTSVIICNEGGHMVPHHSLWQLYSQKIQR